MKLNSVVSVFECLAFLLDVLLWKASERSGIFYIIFCGYCGVLSHSASSQIPTLEGASWHSGFLPFVSPRWSFLKHQVVVGTCFLWPWPRLMELSNLSALAAESIYLLNDLVHWRVGEVLSRCYGTIKCWSAQSPNFVSSRIFSLVHDGDLAFKRGSCCRSTYCPLNDETLDYLFWQWADL